MSSSSMEFLYPHLGGIDLGILRAGGPGLGNMLMPWARCMIAAREEKLPVIAPTWPQLKVGPLRRGEADLRSYFGLFSKSADEVAGPKKAFALAAGTRVAENGELLRLGLPFLRLRVFSGMGRMFDDLRGYSQLIRHELTARARTGHDLKVSPTVPLGIHVRCGDFRTTGDGESMPPKGVRSGERVPIRFYVLALNALRTAVGTPVPAMVYSDGTMAELAPLLALENVHRAASRSALADMLAMSQHQVLLGSPHSTFSMWAAFLGESSYVTFPEAERAYGMASVVLQANIEAWVAQLLQSSVTRRLKT